MSRKRIYPPNFSTVHNSGVKLSHIGSTQSHQSHTVVGKVRRVYLDYATTTPVAPEVVKEMARFFAIDFGNPGSIHAEGVIAKKAVSDARQTIARAIHAHSDELIFTSGGTEANNLAIIGFIEALRVSGRAYTSMHAVTSVIEHASVLECFKELERRGVLVTYVPVDSEGIVSVKAIREVLRPETVLVSVMYANNEIGTIQPIAKIARMIRDFRSPASDKKSFPIFHTDSSQAPLYLDCNQEKLGIDCMTLDGQKIYGPKGIGALYLKRGGEVEPFLFGGGQEKGIRPGTENVPAIVGLASALERATVHREKESVRLTKLRDMLIDEVIKRISGAILNGSKTERLPNNINMSFLGTDTEFLVLQLDAAGIACSTKSACKEGEKASHVVAALENNTERANATIRFSLGADTKKSDIVCVIKTVERLIKKS